VQQPAASSANDGPRTVLLFGATGTAGGSVLQACLAAPEVGEVRAVVRRAPALAHPNLRLVVHQDFLDYGAVAAAFAGVDACFWCLGRSVRQVSGEAEYRTLTRDYAVTAARLLRQQSPAAAFHFISGQGTRADSRMMWARVKAEAERELLAVADAVCWRPAFIDGADAASAPRVYQRLRPLFRLLRPLRSLYVSGEEIGLAMLQATAEGWRSRVVENAEIRALAARRLAAEAS
jgi:uncharacterized protein YbjT (DUF2867 family)